MEKQRFNTDEVYNKILFESENFKVIPSLGCMIEGWLLVIPKKEYISYGAIINSDLLAELNMLVEDVCEVVKNEYGDYIIFEHGPFEKKSKVGCGVDYAHIHVVPIKLNLDLVNAYSDEKFVWDKVDGISAASTYTNLGKSYLYFQDSNHNRYIGTTKEIPSQFFRKIIACVINKPEVYDWKSNLFLDNISNTYVRLNKYNEINSFSKITEYA